MQIISQRKGFFGQRTQGSSCIRKETVDIGTLLTSRNSERKIMQPVRVASAPATRIRKLNQFSQFRWISTKVIPIRRLKLATFRRWPKGSKEAVIEGPADLHICFCTLSNIYIQTTTGSTSPDMTTAFHANLYGSSIEIKTNFLRKKLHRTNQGSNFLGGSFSNTEN